MFIQELKKNINFDKWTPNALGAIGGIQSYELKILHYQPTSITDCNASVKCNIEITLSDYYGNGVGDINHVNPGVVALTLLQHHDDNCQGTGDKPFIHRVRLNHKFEFTY